jgi:acetamidase/formamidase
VLNVATKVACLLIIAENAFAQTPKIHELKASPQTVHRGFLDASLKPVLTVDSGDIVKLETATGNPRYFEKLGVPPNKIPAELYAAFEGVEGDGRGDHTLNGPIYINGAQPGDSLEIRIRSVDVRLPIAGQSFVPNRGLLPDDFPIGKDRVLWLDLKKKTTEFAPGVIVPLRPFWGVIAVGPPAVDGPCSKRSSRSIRGKYGQPRFGFGNHALFAGFRSRRTVIHR